MPQVAAAAAEGHRVVPVPGPSAVLTALVASGLPTAEFTFVGFLPAKQTARLQKLRQLAGECTLWHSGTGSWNPTVACHDWLIRGCDQPPVAPQRTLAAFANA